MTAPEAGGGGVAEGGPVTAGAGGTEGGAASTPALAGAGGRRQLLALAVGLLSAVVLIELLAGPLLKPGRESNNKSRVLGIGGVSALLRGTSIDQTELGQVAQAQPRPIPLGNPAAAVLDGLVLFTVLALAVPARAGGSEELADRDVGRAVQFAASLVALLVGIGLVVAAVRRLRYLAALYLSPPLGTLNYLLLYGSFRRGSSLWVAGVVLALKVGAAIAFITAVPATPSRRGVAGLILTSLGATVVTAGCYALLPGTRGSLADALAAALVAVAAIFWAGVVLSGSVRRLA